MRLPQENGCGYPSPGAEAEFGQQTAFLFPDLGQDPQQGGVPSVLFRLHCLGATARSWGFCDETPPPGSDPSASFCGSQNRPSVERRLPLCLGLSAPCRSRQQEGTGAEVFLHSHAFLTGGRRCSAGSIRGACLPASSLGASSTG